MSRNFGRTRDEITAAAIAKVLVSALKRLESFNGDPEMVIDSCFIEACSASKGVKDAVQALKQHYVGDVVTTQNNQFGQC